MVSYQVIWSSAAGYIVIWLYIWLKEGGQGANGRLPAEVIRYLEYLQYTLHNVAIGVLITENLATGHNMPHIF